MTQYLYPTAVDIPITPEPPVVSIIVIIPTLITGEAETSVEATGTLMLKIETNGITSPSSPLTSASIGLNVRLNGEVDVPQIETGNTSVNLNFGVKGIV